MNYRFWLVLAILSVHCGVMRAQQEAAVSTAVIQGGDVIARLERMVPDVERVATIYQASVGRLEQLMSQLTGSPGAGSYVLGAMLEELIDDMNESAAVLHQLGEQVLIDVNKESSAKLKSLLGDASRITEIMRTAVSQAKMIGMIPTGVQPPVQQQQYYHQPVGQPVWGYVPAQGQPVHTSVGPYDYPNNR